LRAISTNGESSGQKGSAYLSMTFLYAPMRRREIASNFSCNPQNQTKGTRTHSFSDRTELGTKFGGKQALFLTWGKGGVNVTTFALSTPSGKVTTTLSA